MSLLTDLVSYWKLDEASGNALDAHSSNDLTDNNTVGSATGKINNARDFESGSSEYFTGSTSAFSFDDEDFSVSFWINFETIANTFLVGQWDGINNKWLIYFPGDTVKFLTDDVFFNTGWTPAATGTWYHVVLVHDFTNTECLWYVNGSEVGSSAQRGVNPGTTTPFAVGGNAAGSVGYLDGLIDELGIWNRVLTPTEVSDLYNSGAGLSYEEFGGGGGTKAPPLRRRLMRFFRRVG